LGILFWVRVRVWVRVLVWVIFLGIGIGVKNYLGIEIFYEKKK